MAKLIRVGEPPWSWRSHAFTLAWKWRRFGSEPWQGEGEGWRRNSAGLMTAFPRVSSASLGSWAFSITGFLIKKFPAKKIKLNRQYKRNQKSIVQLTFLLCVIERLGPGQLCIQTRTCPEFLSINRESVRILWRQSRLRKIAFPRKTVLLIKWAVSLQGGKQG